MSTDEESIIKYYKTWYDEKVGLSHFPNVYPSQYRSSFSINAFDNDLLTIIKQIPLQWENELNSFEYRSDEFIKNHNGKHILFSGCSNTYGVGLKKDELWSYMLYNKILKNETCSGYFNLSSGGTGIQYIIINLFRYFKKFGNPDIIFLNLPNQKRIINYIPEKQNYYNTYYIEDIVGLNNALFLNYNYYLILEQYCITNKIKLYSISWDIYGEYNTNILFDKYKFLTFYKIDEEKMINEIADGKDKYNYKFYEKARDDMHDGVGYNIWWSNFLYNKYLGQ